LTEVEFY